MPLAATDAAFEGFRVVRRNPMVLVFWALLYLLISTAQLVAMYVNREQIAAGLATLEGFGNQFPSTAQEFAAFLDAYNQVSSYGLLLLPLSIVVGAVLSAGVARAVLFPEQKAFGYLRLGMDEVRVFVVSLVVGLLAAAIMGLAVMVVSVIAAVAVMVPPLWIAVAVGVLATIALFIWLAVKWSLAVPITVSEKKIAIFESFAATKGHFWPLLGMAIVAIVLWVLIAALSMIVVLPLSMLSGIGMGGMGPTTDLLEHLRAANPLLLVSAVANAIVSALSVGVLYAPFAAAWRDLKGG